LDSSVTILLEESEEAVTLEATEDVKDGELG
jgi:hypothetical protein